MGRDFTVKKVLKQMYPATYNFKDEADGTSGTDIDFVDAATLYNGACEIVSDWQGHRKVLRLLDDATGGEDPQIIHNITQATSGIHEFWIGTTDVTKLWRFHMRENAVGYLFRIRITASDLQYLDGGWQIIKAVTDDTLYHLKFEWYADNTWDLWVDGTLEADGIAMENNQVSGMDIFRIICSGDSTAFLYLDAYGEGEDTDYNIGDNVFWRHFKESTDDFESDDVGTQGTSIIWVDSVNQADDHELVLEFNEHKKILRTYQNSGTGDCYHTFASQSTAGWVEFWVKVADANAINGIVQLSEDANVRIWVQIDNDRFEYDAGAGMITAGVAAVDSTWYLVYIQWYADNTFDLWVNNVQYLDGVSTYADFTGSGVNRWNIDQDTAGVKYIYIDAPMSSLDSDERADNRTFDYLEPYTRVDITTDIIDVINYVNRLYEWRSATITSNEDYEFADLFFEIYDINSILLMSGEIKNKDQMEGTRFYPLRDKNWDDLNETLTHTFTSDDIHDPADTTSLLKTTLPNVDHTNGDLLLSTADVKTDTYSPVLKNYPIFMFLRDISDIADSVTILKPNGVVLLDDDLASGDSLDVDNAADKDKLASPPFVTDIAELINYFEIKGAIDPSTGERFSKIVDNSGSDKKRKWRYVNNNFRNQTDVDAYAAKLATRITTIKNITISVQSLGGHNMGETLNFKYVKGEYNISQANYYMIEERILSLNTNLAIIILSEGLIEKSKYASNFERAEEYNNTLATEIYETDKILLNASMFPGGGAAITVNGIECELNEYVLVKIYIDPDIDDDRDIEIRFIFFGNVAGAHIWDGELDVDRYACDGSSDVTGIETNLNFDFETDDGGYNDVTYILASSDVVADNMLEIRWTNKEALTTIVVGVQAKYYIKRTV